MPYLLTHLWHSGALVNTVIYILADLCLCLFINRAGDEAC
jgi:hypothetical protein